MNALELLAHPVRLRIVHAMRGDRTLTTSDLCARLPDVSKATVYRHVEQLAAAGVLETAEERRVRGAVERCYRLRHEHAAITPEMLESLSLNDYRRAFITAMTILMAEFDAYLDRSGADPAADMVGYRQHAVWLTRDELLAFIQDLRDVIAPRLANASAPGRARYLLSPILFPTEAPSA
jgi:DNA-binding transcriptional ArsR family regulator